MIRLAFKRDMNRRRLRILLLVFFLALAIPTAALVYHAYRQLKWESFHQYRGLALELTQRIDSELVTLIDQAESASFGDYAFLVAEGSPDNSYVRPSPLSAVPLADAPPGSIGYFQVNSQGLFSTPFMPPAGVDAVAYGISPQQLTQRRALEERILSVLTDNRLAQARMEEQEIDDLRAADEDVAGVGGDGASSVAGLRDEGRQRVVSQAAFDRLNTPVADNEAAPALIGTQALQSGVTQKKEKADRKLGKVSELNLSSAYDSKSRSLTEASADGDANLSGRSQVRGKRVEQIALPQEIVVADQDAARRRADLRVTTFASEVDPFEFSLLDSGDFVLYRKVWRDEQRYIQGLVLNEAEFLRDTVERHYRQTALSRMSNLIVAYRDDVLQVFHASSYSRAPVVASALTGALLYHYRLSAPLDGLELIFSIESLPPGPGAPVLLWVSLILALILCGGLFTLYRLGLGQIELANQQRDFVSAVSHELKTPLTSIRMYGEMLKEGMADPARKQTYYEFIYDESERLSRLISNVLQLSRISRDQPQIDARAYRAGELMDQVRSRIESQVTRAGFELRFDSDAEADETVIEVDADCLMQIVINLVDNAIKFSGDDSDRKIDIRCRRAAGGDVIFSVRDYGRGISGDRLKKIFERFYRAEDEMTRQTAGTGIGLAIVHQLVVAMGGKIDVLNREPGAEFRVSFPATGGRK